MGNWRHRAPRRIYRQEKLPRVSPLPYHPEPPPPSGFCKDGIPYWEKQFCTLVGSIPWWKVVDAKRYMYGNSNVLNWNDSAGEEAFQNAKQRFWADINGLSCDICLPDPSIYIDEIDWNPIIDPELIKEVDREYFAPDEEEGKGKFGQRNKNTKYSAFVPPDVHNRVPNNSRNPWECDNIQGSGDLKNTVQGTNQWNTNGDNPWESGITQGHGSMEKNAWEDGRDKSWGWNQVEDNITLSKGWDNDVKPWEGGYQGVAAVEGKRWGDPICKSWGYNQQESKNVDHSENRWEGVSNQNNKSLKDRGWRDCGGNEWGSQNNQKNNLDFRIVYSGSGAKNEGGHKRERPHEYISGYKSSRFQGSDYQTGNCWSRGDNRKRVSFARVREKGASVYVMASKLSILGVNRSRFAGMIYIISFLLSPIGSV